MLQNLPFPRDLIDLIQKKTTIQTFKKGDLILGDSHSLIDTSVILLSGACKTATVLNNKKTHLYCVEANPESPKLLFCSDLNKITDINFSITSLINCDVIFIPHNFIIEWAIRFTEFDFLIKEGLRYIFLNILNEMKNISSFSLEDRLIKYLKYKTSFYDDNEIKIPLSEISEDLNFSREAISRSLRKLEEKNLIIKKPRSIIVF
ncbi:Crp/Fnr family transcriptional regulator [Tenacibaculum sp. ZS6-P6]|uniref:Crp/Fnr family transcriptional regulator n=1 Tax=Tenacibaculum sp. ZS6-P6 TaxID=3447503 RepID=UPI003F9D35DD